MKKNGFTLLELSIVIVIIGLIVAGISAGSSLVRQASIRTIATELKNFEVAINSFRLQYDALPGDMLNAHDYWQSACATDADDCNGNGNHYLFGDVAEEWMFWKHLALSQIISGEFTGAAVDGTFGAGNCQSDVNIPSGPIASSAYRIESNSAVLNTNNYKDPHYVIQYGANVNDVASTACTDLPVLTPAEASSIDVKIDDGRASYGLLQFKDSTTATDCLTGGDFDLSNQTYECRLFFSSF